MKHLVLMALAIVILNGEASAQRVDLTPTIPPGLFTTDGVVVSMLSAANPDSNSVTMTGHGRNLLIAHNTGGSTRNVSITSVADSHGRTGTVEDTIDPGEIKIYGPLALEGWRQSNGKVHFGADHTDVEFGVINLP